jgi:hypothetical protein
VKEEGTGQSEGIKMTRTIRITVFAVVVIGIIIGFNVWQDNRNASALTVSSASYLKIEAKQHSKDYKQQWIVAINPYNKTSQQLKILVQDPMVWNLIQLNDTYFTSYSEHRNANWSLDQISMPGDTNSLR